MDGRGVQLPGPTRPRFRCRACQAFVTGTELGNCPRCGVAAPRVTLAARDDRPVPRAARRRWLAVVVVAAIALATALALR
jgi:hypothetical protein